MSKDTVTRSDLLMHVESGEYPIQLSAMQTRHPNISMGPKVDRSYLEGLGYALVTRVARPVNDVVTELPPALIDGVLTQRFESRCFTKEEIYQRLEECKSSKRDELKSALNNALVHGVTFDLNGQTMRVSLAEGDSRQTIERLNFEFMSAPAGKHFIVLANANEMFEVNSKQMSKLLEVCSTVISRLKEEAMNHYRAIAQCDKESNMLSLPHSLYFDTSDIDLKL